MASLGAATVPQPGTSPPLETHQHPSTRRQLDVSYFTPRNSVCKAFAASSRAQPKHSDKERALYLKYASVRLLLLIMEKDFSPKITFGVTKHNDLPFLLSILSGLYKASLDSSHRLKDTFIFFTARKTYK